MNKNGEILLIDTSTLTGPVRERFDVLADRVRGLLIELVEEEPGVRLLLGAYLIRTGIWLLASAGAHPRTMLLNCALWVREVSAEHTVPSEQPLGGEN